MKLSTKGRYGVKAMFDLAMNYGKGPIPLKNIAKRQQISEPYLEQLMASLRRAGLVKSMRGAQGGYMLANSPENITVGQIIKTLEGPLAPTECVIEDETTECSKAEYCVTRLIWEKIRDSINNVIDIITLQDMINDYHKINKKNGYMYYI
ncbi:MAG TPA: Rrf2 family transcriptional regulator [Clostridiales bacterium]|nr:Rrf2 family transcriptional regulator [Clostridiales bacterium]